MKFCRNLQRVIDITDPEWAPYWVNYKMLKKFLKATVPPEDNNADSSPNHHQKEGSSSCCDEKDDTNNSHSQPQHEEEKKDAIVSAPAATIATRAPCTSTTHGTSSAAQMSRNPAEVAFFKLLNSELKKAVHFFDKATIEFEIREERVREGIEIMRKANSLMVNERWSLMAKSAYRLYKDLLLLETYAIMTYCAFSKILKKHDKVTGHNTRCAFMTHVVNKANFTHYPKLLEMIARIERLYDEVSQSLVSEGKSGLYEDERLFINMVQKLNEQVLGTAEQEGAPDTEERKEQRSAASSSFSQDAAIRKGGGSSPAKSTSTQSRRSSNTELSTQEQASTLRSLVIENALNKSSKDGLARVVKSYDAVEEPAAKRTKMET